MTKYRRASVANTSRQLHNLQIDHFIIKREQSSLVRSLVVVALKSCNCDVVCLKPKFSVLPLVMPKYP